MKKFVVVATAVVAGVALGGGIAYASIPGPDGVIHGCRKNTDGSVRVVDSTASCPSGFTALNWSQTGPQGAAGTNGTNGVSGYERMVSSTVISSGASWGLHADCSSGKKVLGGGYLAFDGADITVSQPDTDGLGGGVFVDDWYVQALPTTTGTVQVFALCATVS